MSSRAPPQTRRRASCVSRPRRLDGDPHAEPPRRKRRRLRLGIRTGVEDDRIFRRFGDARGETKLEDGDGAGLAGRKGDWASESPWTIIILPICPPPRTERCRVRAGGAGDVVSAGWYSVVMSRASTASMPPRVPGSATVRTDQRRGWSSASGGTVPSGAHDTARPVHAPETASRNSSQMSAGANRGWAGWRRRALCAGGGGAHETRGAERARAPPPTEETFPPPPRDEKQEGGARARARGTRASRRRQRAARDAREVLEPAGEETARRVQWRGGRRHLRLQVAHTSVGRRVWVRSAHARTSRTHLGLNGAAPMRARDPTPSGAPTPWRPRPAPTGRSSGVTWWAVATPR